MKILKLKIFNKEDEIIIKVDFNFSRTVEKCYKIRSGIFFTFIKFVPFWQKKDQNLLFFTFYNVL